MKNKINLFKFFKNLILILNILLHIILQWFFANGVKSLKILIPKVRFSVLQQLVRIETWWNSANIGENYIFNFKMSLTINFIHQSTDKDKSIMLNIFCNEEKYKNINKII